MKTEKFGSWVCWFVECRRKNVYSLLQAHVVLGEGQVTDVLEFGQVHQDPSPFDGPSYKSP